MNAQIRHRPFTMASKLWEICRQSRIPGGSGMNQNPFQELWTSFDLCLPPLCTTFAFSLLPICIIFPAFVFQHYLPPFLTCILKRNRKYCINSYSEWLLCVLKWHLTYGNPNRVFKACEIFKDSFY